MLLFLFSKSVNGTAKSTLLFSTQTKTLKMFPYARNLNRSIYYVYYIIKHEIKQSFLGRRTNLLNSSCIATRPFYMIKIGCQKPAIKSTYPIGFFAHYKGMSAHKTE